MLAAHGGTITSFAEDFVEVVLPGPRPVTALSPGLAVRLGIPKTPLAFLLSGTYRPQLRTWEATVSGPGANVFQFGLAVAVDVTLWKIFARGK